MLDRARERAHELGRPVTLRPMNLLSLDFPDGAFDTVSATFVLLCLPDELQEAALRELRRVTRPGGRILILDYRQSPKAGLRLLRQCLAPWMRWAFAGSFEATTERYLAAAGLATIHRRTFMGDGVNLMVLEPTTRAEASHSAA